MRRTALFLALLTLALALLPGCTQEEEPADAKPFENRINVISNDRACSDVMPVISANLKPRKVKRGSNSSVFPERVKKSCCTLSAILSASDQQ